MIRSNQISFHKENTVAIDLTLDGVDLTGATIYFTVKTDFDDDSDDSTAVIQKDVTVHTDAAAGETVINLTPAETNVATGKYRYDIKLETGAGAQRTLVVGRCTIKDVVTNRG